MNDDLSERLSNLLEFGRNVTLQLLYRGSRDGSQAQSFHSRCDSSSGTITIVKTVGGYIFGGYTTARWKDQASNQQINNCRRCREYGYCEEMEDCDYEEMQSYDYENNVIAGSKYSINKQTLTTTKCVNDPSAYIFSLVNKYDYPVRMNVKEGVEAICQNPSAGPIFGQNDQESSEIYVGCNNTSCFSYIGNSYQLPEKYFSLGESLAESNNFQLKEIEVFSFLS